MSTKIYNGIRFPLSRLNEFLNLASDIATKLAAADIFRVINNLDPKQVKKWIAKGIARERYQSYSPDEKIMARFRICYFQLSELMSKESKDWSILNPYNKQAGWSLFVRGRYAYGWPWGEYFNESAEGVIASGWVEEYGYWNSSDKPKEVSASAWQKRKQIWDEITEDRKEFTSRLTYQTVDFSGGHISQFIIRELVMDLVKSTLSVPAQALEGTKEDKVSAESEVTQP
jgi:hypothetical protein